MLRSVKGIQEAYCIFINYLSKNGIYDKISIFSVGKTLYITEIYKVCPESNETDARKFV